MHSPNCLHDKSFYTGPANSDTDQKPVNLNARPAATTTKGLRQIERRKKLLASGLCINCGKNPPVDSKTQCQDCLDSMKHRAEKRKALIAAKKADVGVELCNHCGEREVAPKRKSCVECLAEAREYRRNAEKSTICRCGQTKDVGFQMCDDCLNTRADGNLQWLNGLRDEVYAAYGGYVCVCCGETEESFMTLDHVDNDGAEHRREIGADGVAILRWAKRNNFPPGLAPMCRNCNWSKHVNGGTCIHEFRRNEDEANLHRDEDGNELDLDTAAVTA